MTTFISIAENIWILNGNNVNFHGFAYPTRSVFVRLQNGGLWVWSPVELSDGLRSEVQTIGRPAHLVSPNKLHHLFLGEWHAAFPDAKLWGPASTIRKYGDLPFQSPLVDEPPAAWAGQIDQCWVRGSLAMDEIVFFHLLSRTVILADLSQNFSPKWLSENWAPWQRSVARISKITEAKSFAPLDWRLSFIHHRKLRVAREKILGWDPWKVIMAHGEWQPQHGGEFLARAFEWIS
ncbi:DUF4336 domain-containing protein [Bradyrhizobium jicamae]|nr:DUF4336 domain-containing protein [Bradyrhizobium jicamae]